jgi:NADH pyrophosphatase NudC (nudix superfamily)
MTQDEIIEMATQVSERNYGRIIFFEFEVEELEAFAKLVAAKAIAELESQERNFCPRCGKRTNDIHTCTPPMENT